MSPFDDLPAAVRALVPEAADAPPGEARATCEACPRTRAEVPAAWRFTVETRCCTYHPALPSFLAGRALARGGPGADLVRARLADPDGVSPRGVFAPGPHAARYPTAEFGRDPGLRCPFWVGGERSCGVWADRPTTCRAWFCAHDDGLGGAVEWSQRSFLLAEAEARLAAYLVTLGTPPAPGAAPDAWEAWFRWCAGRIETVTAAEVAALGSPDLRARRDQLVAIRRRPARALAEVLVAAISDVAREGDRVHLSGYSSYDAVAAPAAVFAFLSRLDGTTPWREALAAARAETGALALDEPLVRELHRVGALRAASGADDLPFRVELVPAAAWTHTAHRPR